MFIPGGKLMSFPFFLISLLIIGCGLTFLETSANPYIAVLGEREKSARRLNLAQSFNGLGWVVGPLVGGLLILGEDSDIAVPYGVIGCVVIALGIVFMRIKLPTPEEEGGEAEEDRKIEVKETLWKVKTFRYGVMVLLLYVAAQTGINSFFINYVTESGVEVSSQTAAMMLSFGGMGLFMVGRLFGTVVMRYIKPSSMMQICAAGAIVCMMVTIICAGRLGIVGLCVTYLFESVMFPTIFSMSLSELEGERTKTASSFLVMSIVGGAIAPVVMGVMGKESMSVGFVLPLICFVIIAVYAFSYERMKLAR